VEAWLVKASDFIGFVKGCNHPLPEYIVVPRIVKGSKTWSAVHPRLAKETPCFDFPVSVAGPSARFLSPVDAAQRLRRNCASGVCRAALELLDALASAVGWDSVGVTGSLAYSPEQADDIDIVVYGYGKVLEAYRVLAELRGSGLTRPYLGRGHAWSREDRLLHAKLARKRLLFGVFQGYEYNVRLVTCTSPAPCTRVRSLGHIEVRGRLCSALGFTTPAHYMLCTTGGHRVHIVTYRLRYSELPLGVMLEVRGLRQELCGRELVTPDHGGYIRIVGYGAGRSH